MQCGSPGNFWNPLYAEYFFLYIVRACMSFSVPCSLPCAVSCSTEEFMGGITCILPPGTGRDVSVQVGVGIYKKSSIYPLLSYAGPTISSLHYPSCQQDNPTALDVCPRDGGLLLTVRGSSFGSSGAVVLVGAALCLELQHRPVVPIQKHRVSTLSCTCTACVYVCKYTLIC